MRSLLVAVAFLAFTFTSAGFGQGSSNASEPAACAECRFNFGAVAQGTVVEHQFPLRNDGEQPLRIANVQLTPPLKLARMPAVIPARSSVVLKLTLDTSKVEGEFSGQLLVMLSEQMDSPHLFSLTGKVTRSIEVLPRPAFFLSTSKGVAKSATLEIVNHESAPLVLKLETPATTHYSAKLETVNPGQRYRLTATIPSSAPAGRNSDRLKLTSSSASKPIVYIGVNTIVRERVYTFPDVVDFGRLRMSELRSAQAAQAVGAQTLMVYQTGGRDFFVKTDSTVPGLELATERGPQGDRVQITASLLSAKAAPGLIRGTIQLHTNDPTFPELTVPVTGEIVAD